MIKIRFFQFTIFSQHNLKTLAICYIATINMVKDNHSRQTTNRVDNKYINEKMVDTLPYCPKTPQRPS